MCKASNSQVFAAFSNRATAQGDSVRSVVTDNATVLYSYGTPIAYFPDHSRQPTFTTRKFSATTSKQATQARSFFDDVEVFSPEDFVTGAKMHGADFGWSR